MVGTILGGPVILNISRAKELLKCPRSAFNRYHLNMSGERSMNLVDGGAFHKGIAEGQAKRDWQEALIEAKKQFNTDLSAANLMPEEDFLADAHWQVVKKGIELYKENWQDFGMTVVQPECSFDVEIPGTEHNDVTLHWVDPNGDEHWGMPDPTSILARAVGTPHSRPDPSCPCYRSHRLVGRVDGILSWQGYFWLQEHKTTSIIDDRFWNQWQLDLQPTGYIYGVHKATGIRPRGVVFNAIYKPSESQIANWNSKRKHGPPQGVTDYMKYERQIFLRDDASLRQFERDFTSYCDEWEWRILTGRFPLAPLNGHCYNYNRQCDFHFGCSNPETDFQTPYSREADYVDDTRQQLLIQITGAHSG
jgi:hypothetical protein